MATEKMVSTGANTPYLQPPPGRQYVRSFLFTRKLNAPLAKVHIITRTFLVLCLSCAQIRAINTAHPDLLGALLLCLCGCALFLSSGIPPKVMRIYVLVTSSTLFSLFITWNIFNPVPSPLVFWQHQVYPGYIDVGLAGWQLLWLAVVVVYFWWKRSILGGILLASLLCILLSILVTLPAWNIARVSLFHPLTITITDRGILLALTKVFGYSGMLLSTIALVVTSRDVELIGALRQLRFPQPVIFFLSTVFRALNLTLADYEIIRQAQISRAINARPRSLFRRIRDAANMAVPMVAMMIRRSSEIGDALLARGYTVGRKNSEFYEVMPFRWIDGVFVLLSLALLLMAFGPYAGLTTLLQSGW